MSIWDGFEGYRDPTENEAISLLQGGTVVLDTNVLLDLYSIPESAQNLALDAVEFLRERIHIPHQVMREFWRNRHSAIAEAPTPTQPLEAVRGDLRGIVNSLRPDRGRSEELDEIRAQIDKTLDDLKAQIDNARGAPLDVRQILEDNTLDPVLQRLERILDGRVGASFGDDEDSVIEIGLKRFNLRIPPGYMDGKEKGDQLPERGTGDFLLWEQTLRFVSTLPEPRSFVLVTNDSKEDWRSVISQPRKQALGARPELVAEALTRANAKFILLRPNDFYRLMDKIRSVDADASRSLRSALETVSENRINAVSEWSASAYRSLLSRLRADGYLAQADVIELAAESGGLAPRADIYEVAGYADDRSLRRFSLPAQRVTIDLIDAGALSEGAPFPLEAVYEGPGKTVGYTVPEEFVRFAAAPDPRAPHEHTWLEAAAHVAERDPGKVWTVDELVDAIITDGLRDASGAKTPAATLRRDLHLRGSNRFEKIGAGFRLNAPHLSS